jgi:hypothetical protein
MPGQGIFDSVSDCRRLSRGRIASFILSSTGVGSIPSDREESGAAAEVDAPPYLLVGWQSERHAHKDP